MPCKPVHVDSDELFDPGARSIHDHFRYLEASRFDWFCYHNFEAVPEVAFAEEVDPCVETNQPGTTSPKI